MSNLIKKKYSKSGVSSVRDFNSILQYELDTKGVVILPPQDITDTLQIFSNLKWHFDTIMLDPWYNKGTGGVQDDYHDFYVNIIGRCGVLASHIYFWGFPEIVAPFVERIPKPLQLTCWLTWYYKNNPSVIRGWRSAQNACLHISNPNSVLYPERFLNQKQLDLQKKGKLRYMPGPTSVLEDLPTDVIEQSLLVGFVGRNEQTGHPSQKPFKIYDQLLKMTVSNNGLILDPMCGSGTLGAVAKERGYKAILCDKSDEYTKLTEKRLGIKRINLASIKK